MGKTLEQNTEQEVVKVEKTIEELVNGTPEELAQATKMLEEAEFGESEVEIPVEQTEATPVETTPVETAPVETAPVVEAPTEPAFEVINYQGHEVKIENPDGFLGRKDFGGLIKSHAHLSTHAKRIEEENAELRRKAIELAKQQEAYKKQMDELKEKAVIQSVPPATPQEPTKPVETPIVDLKVPVRPNISLDPLSWEDEDRAVMEKYYRDVDDYNANLKELLLKKVNTPASAPIAESEELVQIKAKLEKFESVAKSLEQQKEEARIKAEEARQKIEIDNYWNQVEEFRKVHSEFSTHKGSIRELHNNTQEWMNQLAVAAGHRLPPNPTQAEVEYFESTKLNLANQYLSGDQSLVNTGVMPPADVDEYFKLSEVENKRLELIQKGLLGEKASLHNAYVIINEQSGTLDKGVEAIEVNARKQGANAILDMARGHQENDAVNLPTNAGNTGVQADATHDQALLNQAINASPIELQQNPILAKILNDYAEGTVSN